MNIRTFPDTDTLTIELADHLSSSTTLTLLPINPMLQPA